VNWSIVADNVIQWKAIPLGATSETAAKPVTFSRQSAGDKTKIYAEVCSTFNHHDNMKEEIQNFWQRGVVKAYFV
jgi:hypothetical protein